MSTDQGRFVLVRSDHVSTVIDKPNVPLVIGRSASLPAHQQLHSKYISREQLCAIWQPPVLVVRQMGKNPTFYGPGCGKVPRLDEPALVFKGDSGITAPAQHVGADGQTVVSLPMCDPVHATAAPPLTQTDAATLYFPSEVGLPCVAIRCERTQATEADTREGANAATSTLSAAQMLAVPTLSATGGGDSDDEEDDKEEGGPRGGSQPVAGGAAAHGRGSAGGGGSRPEWQGLLDAAMQQKHRQEVASEQQQQQQQSTTPSRPSVPLPPAPAPSPAPPVAPQTKQTPTPPPPASPHAAAAPTVPAAAQTLGFWEWKCHANGPDHDPKSWRKYPLAVAQRLEEAYRAKRVTVDIPDSLLSGGGGQKRGRAEKGAGRHNDAGAATYAVCFKEANLGGGMIQYQKSDTGKFRVVRRTGGDEVDFSHVKAAHIIPQSDTDDDDDEDSSEESDFSESESESVSSSSSSDDDKRRKPQKKRTKK